MSSNMLARLQGTVVGFTGPVEEMLTGAGGVRLCRSTAGVRATPSTIGVDWNFDAGLGISERRLDSRMAAVGEAFERYAVACVDSSRVQVRTATDDAPHLAADEFAHFLPEQYESARFPLRPPPARDEPIPWIPGLDLATGEETWLPGLVCSSYFVDHRSGETTRVGRWFEPTSNGVAAGGDPLRATLSALLELIERDAFMLMWYHRLRFPDVRVPPGGPLAALLDRVVRSARVRARLIDLTEVHGIPCVLAVLWRDCDGRPVHSLGGAAATTLDRAATKALSEAAGLYEGFRLRAMAHAQRTMSPEEVTGFAQHVEYFTDPAHRDAIDWLLEPVDPAPEVSRPRPERTLAQLATGLRAQGIRTYAVDLTPVEGADAGLCVYRVVSPDLLMLEMDHNARQLGSARLRNWPSAMAAGELNPDPHPFS